ncbi:hypothetical protein [Pantoea vagans]|uniref:hypothetical protein n=1 Tax=Pantoea vagans TaxID=470934 RepID=UPI00131AEF3A|nr:hypothetical protein [Pantoea vagans]
MPQDTIEKALKLIHQRQDELVIKRRLTEQLGDAEMVSEHQLWFIGTLSDLRLS